MAPERPPDVRRRVSRHSSRWRMVGTATEHLAAENRRGIGGLLNATLETLRNLINCPYGPPPRTLRRGEGVAHGLLIGNLLLVMSVAAVC